MTDIVCVIVTHHLPRGAIQIKLMSVAGELKIFQRHKSRKYLKIPKILKHNNITLYLYKTANYISNHY